jgi:hypothetical protein
VEAFRSAWKGLTKDQRELVADKMEIFKARAEGADAMTGQQVPA